MTKLTELKAMTLRLAKHICTGSAGASGRAAFGPLTFPWKRLGHFQAGPDERQTVKVAHLKIGWIVLRIMGWVIQAFQLFCCFSGHQQTVSKPLLPVYNPHSSKLLMDYIPVPDRQSDWFFYGSQPKRFTESETTKGGLVAVFISLRVSRYNHQPIYIIPEIVS